MVVLERYYEKLTKARKTTMHISQTYGNKSAVCFGACRRFEAGAKRRI